MLAYGEQFGGAERQVVTLARGLRDSGVPVEAFLRYDRELAAQLRSEDIVVRIESAQPGRDFAAELLAPGSFGERPVLHSHNTRGAVFASALRVRHGVAAVKTEHGSAIAPASRPRLALSQRLARAAEIAALRASRSAVVFVSTELARAARWWTQSGSARVIPNGVEVAQAVGERPTEFAADAFNVVFAGRLEAVKAPLTAVKAVSRVPGESRIRLFVLGQGSLRAAVEAMARTSPAAARISILGFRERAAQYVAHADALILPSLHEGLPYVALEALAAGTPIAASEVGGLAEFLEDRRTVLFAPPADAEAFAERLLRLERDPALRSRLAASGRELVQSRLSAAAMVQSYVDLYAGLTARANRARR